MKEPGEAARGDFTTEVVCPRPRREQLTSVKEWDLTGQSTHSDRQATYASRLDLGEPQPLTHDIRRPQRRPPFARILNGCPEVAITPTERPKQGQRQPTLAVRDAERIVRFYCLWLSGMLIEFCSSFLGQ
ncbi:hypothetical protein MRX96_021694 [Rhipicephalus microplus]